MKNHIILALLTGVCFTAGYRRGMQETGSVSAPTVTEGADELIQAETGDNPQMEPSAPVADLRAQPKLSDAIQQIQPGKLTESQEESRATFMKDLSQQNASIFSTPQIQLPNVPQLPSSAQAPGKEDEEEDLESDDEDEEITDDEMIEEDEPELLEDIEPDDSAAEG